MSRMHDSNGFRPIAAVGALFLSTTATLADSAPPSMTPTAQDRSVSAFVIVPPCGPPSSLSDFDEATDFSTFQSQADAVRTCTSAQGLASSGQYSEINPTQILAYVASCSSAAANPMTVIHAISSSSFEVEFTLGARARFLAEIALSIDSSSSIVYVNSLAQLKDAANAVVFSEGVALNGSAGSEDVKFEATGVLEPGHYTIRAVASAIIDHTIPPSGAGISTSLVDMLVTKPADFNLDGLVDGSDLGSLLGAWGPCAGCAEDLDGDGVVGGSDLGDLLGSWD
ncbi:MAG: hypothetical protein FJ253_06735 [Phycisphaerae bacterium]|nr:hypothetical protein [Phycisphaerae bacterium]